MRLFQRKRKCEPVPAPYKAEPSPCRTCQTETPMRWDECVTKCPAWQSYKNALAVARMRGLVCGDKREVS